MWIDSAYTDYGGNGPMNFTAHIKENSFEKQTVQEHLINTSELSSEFASKINLSNFAELQGILHDIGKFTSDFNKYINGNSKFKRGDIDHSFEGARYIFEIANNTEEKKLIQTARVIAHTIVSHHGLHDWLKDNGDDYFSERVSNDERYYESIENFKKYFQEERIKVLLKKANEEFNGICMIIQSMTAMISEKDKKKKSRMFYLGMFERLVQSILIDADRTDTAAFMLDKKIVNSYEKPWGKMKQRIEEKLSGFSVNTDKISVRRMDISERCKKFAYHNVDVCRLIVPTGGGKTLSSLRFAIEYCLEHDMERIFYIAPFMSILEQNSDEIRSITGDELFLEHHSNVIQEIDDEDELSDYELKTEKWDLPVIATTMVQFLNTLFSDKMSSVRRMHQLCKSVIIIDEVQSVPLKCVNLFNLAVNFLSKICGSTVVLCSATQPVFNQTDYPLLYDEQTDMTGDFKDDFDIFRRTEVVPAIVHGGYSYEEAADFCFEKYLSHGNLLIVVNTKEAAAEIYTYLKEKNTENVNLFHLSTNMCPQHRKDIITDIRKSLKSNENTICVTTQLIEAGVDISFGCVVRSLAGMDNAAQAAGRCNRHGERDNICPVYIINIAEEKLSHFPEIRDAQNISIQIFDNKSFDDLLSPETMEAYFKKLYFIEKNQLSYPLKNKNVTILELLSDNKKCWDIKQNPDIVYSSQAFKTAGSNFEVIVSNTCDVIVPYNEEADNMILDLNSDINPEEFVNVSRKVQKYMISVYETVYNNLIKSNALEFQKSGVIALKKEFFDDELGINFGGSVPDTLLY